jgi:hypothetical protein
MRPCPTKSAPCELRPLRLSELTPVPHPLRSERARYIYLTYLALVTSLLTITSRNFITATVLSFYDNNGTINIKDTKQSANNAAAAGAIMLCITNYALIIFIGLGGLSCPSLSA